MQPYDGFSDHGEVEGANSMNTQNVWIKRSEREPGKFDWPLFAGYYDATLGWTEFVVHRECPIGNATHWRSIKCDPPPRELTQREKDATLARNIAMVNECTVTECVLEGIYAERREVLRALQDAHGHDWGADEDWAKHAQKLRARLDEQGAK